jgi:hypothetical protein
VKFENKNNHENSVSPRDPKNYGKEIIKTKLNLVS